MAEAERRVAGQGVRTCTYCEAGASGACPLREGAGRVVDPEGGKALTAARELLGWTIEEMTARVIVRLGYGSVQDVINAEAGACMSLRSLLWELIRDENQRKARRAERKRLGWYEPRSKTGQDGGRP